MSRQRGLTVAELLIAVVIGALVALLAVTLLLTSNAGFLAQAQAASVDEAGRFALASIERAARQAAFVDWEREDMAAGLDPGAPPRIRGLDAATLPASSAALANPRPHAVNGSDILALRFAGAGPDEGDGSMTTCAGFSVGAGQDGWSIFYVGRNAAGVAELRCKYKGASNWSAEAVIGGVDSFQVLYGVDTDTVPDGTANSYLSASDINALDTTLALDGATDAQRGRDQMRKTWWKRVASIKVALVLHGATPSRDAYGAVVLDLFGAAYSRATGAADRGTRLTRAELSPELQERERRTFSATILLRNRQSEPAK
ncbi:MAG: PilW family protein [Massilia sp.]|nr:PilW family protein [Massilia sp.]